MLPGVSAHRFIKGFLNEYDFTAPYTQASMEECMRHAYMRGYTDGYDEGYEDGREYEAECPIFLNADMPRDEA